MMKLAEHLCRAVGTENRDAAPNTLGKCTSPGDGHCQQNPAYGVHMLMGSALDTFCTLTAAPVTKTK